MNAANSRLQISAHNIANLATDGFRRQVAVHAQAASGGATVSLEQASEPGSSLETDVVGLLQAKNAFLANLAVFRTGDRMMGALLDAKS